MNTVAMKTMTALQNSEILPYLFKTNRALHFLMELLIKNISIFYTLHPCQVGGGHPHNSGTPGS